jgi:hypothetical protein
MKNYINNNYFKNSYFSSSVMLKSRSKGASIVMLQLKKNGDEGDEGHDKGGVGRGQVVLRGGDQGRKASDNDTGARGGKPLTTALVR